MNRTCVLLTVMAAMERFAFKGVACNLVVYLTDVVKMGNSSAVKTVNTWCGVTTMLPLFVAPLADSYWNHYSTIFISSSFYALGLTALTLTAVEWSRIPAFSGSCLFWSLSVVSLAQATCNSSLQAFAADQLYSGDDDDHDSDKKMATKSMFFQWWYVGICGGSLLGVTVMSYLQDRVGWDVGFAVPSAAMVAAVVLFTSRRHCYTYKHESSLLRTHLPTSWKKIIASLFRRHNPIAAVEIQMEEKPLRYAKEEEEEEEQEEKRGNTERRRCIDVEKMKVVLKLVPIWMTLLPFAIIFQLPTTYFTKQGATMERRIGGGGGGGGFMVPPAMLQAAITISIIVLTPLYDKVLVPVMKGVSVMERMGVGMVLTVVAMVVGVAVERRRMRMGRGEEGKGGGVVEMSILWLLPQYVLLGVSDVFTVVGMQEFFYRWAPEGMKTTGIAMYTSVFGMGGLMGAAVVAVVEGATRGEEGWLVEEMVAGGGGRLDKYYGLLGCVSALSLVVYLGLCRWFPGGVVVVTPSSSSSVLCCNVNREDTGLCKDGGC